MKSISKHVFCLCLAIGLTMSLVAINAAQGESKLQQMRGAKENKVVDASAKAPTGTYSATTGATARTSSVAGATKRGRTAKTTEAGSGQPISISISSYSPSSELQAVANAGAGNVAKAMSAYNHGSITIGDQTFPINVASSATVGGNFIIYLVTSKPLSASGQNAEGTGATTGMIELKTPTAGGAGTGKMYTNTEVAISANGTVTARAGTSSATALTTVNKTN